MQRNGSARRAYGSGSIIERRGAWYGKWRVGDRQVQRKLGAIRQPGSRDGLTRKQAEAALRRLMSEVRVVAPEERMTFAEVGDRFLVHLRGMGRKRSTVGEYESMLRVHLMPYYGDRAVDKIGPADVEGYIARKARDGKAPKTVRNHLGLLHSIFTYGERRGWSRGNPCKHVDAPRAGEGDADIRFLDEAELAALLRAVDVLLDGIHDPESGPRSARTRCGACTASTARSTSRPR